MSWGTYLSEAKKRMTDKKQEAFIALYEPVHEQFERFCRARVYGDMEHGDLINETLLACFDKFDTIRNKQAFLSFLFSIAIRILAKNHRKNRTAEIHESQWESIADQSIPPDISTDVHYLYSALAVLSDDQRESIILFEISGFSIKEIAAMQKASESAVKQRLKRGREKLKEVLTRQSTLEIKTT